MNCIGFDNFTWKVVSSGIIVSWVVVVVDVVVVVVVEVVLILSEIVEEGKELLRTFVVVKGAGVVLLALSFPWTLANKESLILTLVLLWFGTVVLFIEEDLIDSDLAVVLFIWASDLIVEDLIIKQNY